MCEVYNIFSKMAGSSACLSMSFKHGLCKSMQLFSEEESMTLNSLKNRVKPENSGSQCPLFWKSQYLARYCISSNSSPLYSQSGRRSKRVIPTKKIVILKIIFNEYGLYNMTKNNVLYKVDYRITGY